MLLLNAVWKPDSGYLSILYHNTAGVSDIPKNLPSACRRPKGAQIHHLWSKHPSQSIPETANLNYIFFFLGSDSSREGNTHKQLPQFLEICFGGKAQGGNTFCEALPKKDKTLTLSRGWHVGMQLKGLKRGQTKITTHTNKHISWQHNGLSCLQNGLPEETWASLALDARQQSCQKSPFSSIPAFLTAKVKLIVPRMNSLWALGKKKKINSLGFTWACSIAPATQKGQNRSSNFSTWDFQVVSPKDAPGFHVYYRDSVPRQSWYCNALKL